MKNAEITDPVFHEAVEAIDNGNIAALQTLINDNPGLVTSRLQVPAEGYFAHPYLLWFVADNPIRHEKLPPNIVAIAATIIKALQNDQHPSYQHQLDHTLGLVCTGRIAKECGVQIALMELLIQEGARVKGSVLGPIGQHNFEAAAYLLAKDADYNLATAVGLNRVADIKNLLKNAAAAELYVALVVAAFFGRADIISRLIEAGANVNGNASDQDFGGFHAHASPLHQAVYSGSLEAVQLLVKAGADLNATDKANDGTPLDWAKYMQAESKHEMSNKYKAIEGYLFTKQHR